MKKNILLTFIFACVPGCGQMYQGYMKRGVSMLGWSAVLGLIVYLTRADIFLLFFPVIWAYSFFDAFHLRNLSAAQRDAFTDKFIPSTAWLNSAELVQLKGKVNVIKTAGWACIAIGAIVLLGNFYDVFLTLMYRISPELAEWLRYSGGVIVGVAIGAAVILLGIRLLRNPKIKDGESLGEVEISVPQSTAEVNE